MSTARAFLRPSGVMKDEEAKDEFDATLMEWTLCDLRDRNGDIWPVILAEVWRDKLGRWEDGTRIIAAVLRPMPEPSLRFDDVVQTKSTAYLLGRPSSETIQ